MKIYTMFRSLLYHKMFVNFRCRMCCIYMFTVELGLLEHVRMLSVSSTRFPDDLTCNISAIMI